MKIIDVIEINQDENRFYVGKMTVRELTNIATSKIRTNKNDKEYKSYLEQIGELATKELDNFDIDELKGFIDKENHQRQPSIDRMKNIGKDINDFNTIFPNSIICNVSLKKGVLDEETEKVIEDYIFVKNNKLYFEESDVDVCIIDGQHRLGGFKYANDEYKDKYDMVVTFLIGLTPAEQAELFATINGKQKSVNKSVLYDLSVMSTDEYSIQLMSHLMTTWFNRNEKSPLYGKIKMLGVGEGTISQAAMIDALTPLFTKKKINKKKVPLELPVLLKLYEDKNTKNILQLLYDYFKCFISYFEKSKYENPIYLKSTGIAGLIKAFPTVYLKYATNNSFDKESLIKDINNNLISFVPTSDKYKGGGFSMQNEYAKDLLKLLLNDDNYGNEYRMNFKVFE